jgi:DNA-binding NtrC family response regulator
MVRRAAEVLSPLHAGAPVTGLKRYIESALAQNDGQITRTAERLGISRKNLWEKMRRLELRAP